MAGADGANKVADRFPIRAINLERRLFWTAAVVYVSETGPRIDRANGWCDDYDGAMCAI